MRTVRLGRTRLEVNALGFGALPLQRIPLNEAVRLLHRATDEGVAFFDTARMYTDSEQKLGAAFADRRQRVIIATKAKSDTGAAVTQSLHDSLTTLGTDYVDILQIHNPSSVPLPGDGTGRYEALLEAKLMGKARFIGLSAHSLDRAVQALRSGLYDTIQYPFSFFASPQEVALVEECHTRDVGFLAMKALGGGLIRNIPAAFAFLAQHDHVLPLWGIQRMEELEEFLALRAAPPVWDEALARAAEEEKQALGTSFCRGCGYCLPCPAGIDIPYVARSALYLRRMPLQKVLGPVSRASMRAAMDCIQCHECAPRCPYGLDTPELVRVNLEAFVTFLRENGHAPLEDTPRP